jgi:hypothetical protein
MTTLPTETLAEYILVEYRWVVVITLLMPLSLLWKIWSTLRSYVVFKLNSAPKMHDKKVKNVQKQVCFALLYELFDFSLSYQSRI